MNKSSVFAESTLNGTQQLPDINQQLYSTKSMAKTTNKFVFSSNAMSQNQKLVTAKKDRLQNLTNIHNQMRFSSLNHPTSKDTPNLDNKFQLRNSL